MDTTARQDAASQLVAGRRERRTVPHPPEAARPGGVDDAYAIQDELVRQLGVATVGWKIGANSPAAQASFGLPAPLAGRVLADRCHHSGVTLEPAHFAAPPLIECELGLRLARDVTAGPFTAAALADAVGEVAPTIELAGGYYESFPTIGGLGILADNGGHLDLVVGSGNPAWRQTDLSGVRLRLLVDGNEVAAGTPGESFGDPLEFLAWLAADRVERGEPLRAGQIISTGTCTGAVPATWGSQVTNDAGPFGEVRLTLGA